MSSSAGVITPGAVVFATGTPPTLEGLDLQLPADTVKGHLVVTEPAPITLPGMVAPPGHPARRWPPAGRRNARHRRRHDRSADRGHRPDPRRAGRRTSPPGPGPPHPPMVLLAAPPSRRAARHRPPSRVGQRLDHQRALSHRHLDGPGDRLSARPMDCQRPVTCSHRALDHPPALLVLTGSQARRLEAHAPYPVGADHPQARRSCLPGRRPAETAPGDPMLIAAIKNRADRLQRSAPPAQNAQFGATPTITGAARREVPNGGPGAPT